MGGRTACTGPPTAARARGKTGRTSRAASRQALRVSTIGPRLPAREGYDGDDTVVVNGVLQRGDALEVTADARQQLVDPGDRQDTVERIVQGLVHGGELTIAHLQPDEAHDLLQVVLDPVVHLLYHGGADHQLRVLDGEGRLAAERLQDRQLL